MRFLTPICRQLAASWRRPIPPSLSPTNPSASLIPCPTAAAAAAAGGFTSRLFHHSTAVFCSQVKPPARMSRIVWMDMEMTGLDPHADRIMEVCCVITDNDLQVLATGPELVVHHPQSTLDAMSEWCRTTHAKTGMSAACLRSTSTVLECEDRLLQFLQSQNIGPRECPLAGNTIYMDRLFLAAYMPRVNEYLHYRLIDVSTCKELCKRWNPRQFAQAPVKRLVHRGLDDILESIDELKYYRQFMFRKEQREQREAEQPEQVNG